MKTRILPLLAIVSLLVATPALFAADVAIELKELVAKINAKMQAGEPTEKDLAAEFKAFDDILAAHKDEKTEEVAQVLYMKSTLYMHFDSTEKGIEGIKQLKKDFPNTKMAQNADKILASMEKQAQSKKIQADLVAGKPFPTFEEKDVTGKPISFASYKGKVVLVDFWATWCGPCITELPSVMKTYEKHHGAGFEIIGISLDSDEAKLNAFTKEHKMVWQQYFDGKGWDNKLAGKYGVTSIPATYLLDGQGNIIAKDLRGDALEAAVAKALAKK